MTDTHGGDDIESHRDEHRCRDEHGERRAADLDSLAGEVPPTDGLVGVEAGANLPGFAFGDVRLTVDAENDADGAADDYPVLRAPDRATQLEARE